LTLCRFFVALLLLALSGCERQSDPKIEPPIETGQPALWKVDNGKGGTGWLFGTIHLLPEGTDWQSGTLDKAMQQSGVLVVEASGLDDPQAVSRIFTDLGMRAGLPPLSQRVDPQLKPILRDAMQRSNVPAHGLNRMESWAATLALASAMGAGMGLETEAGVEQVLIRRYRADEKPVAGLETISGQLGLFDQLPEAEQRAMLNATLRGAANSQTKFEEQFRAWHRGNIEALTLNDPDGILASPVLRERLLDGRNRAWAGQIAAMLRQDNSPFIAVGAAHLPGKGGVIALLESKGFILTRLQ
jgi:uncharacterized protein YbaP (TraB family)